MVVHWLADIHLNFLDKSQLEKFIERLAKKKADGFIIAGDIGEADSLFEYLRMLSDKVGCPIYFVLGNHDYYRASIDYVRAEIVRFLATQPSLHWLNQSGIISLSSNTALVGHDSWADARLGDFWKSTAQLNDFVLIGDFLGKTKRECFDRMGALAGEAAQHFQRVLPVALAHHKKVIIVTHVPPFKEAALYKGKVCDANWLPFFSSSVVGEVLLKIMAQHPDREAVVLCGHTHGSAVYKPLPNLTVVTGGATYGKPTIHRALEV